MFKIKLIDYLKLIYRYFRNNFVHVSRYAIIKKRKLVHLAKGVEIKEYVIIKTYKSPVKVGELSQINPYTVIYGGAGVEIGKNVMIGPHCMLAAGSHEFRQTHTPMRHAGNFDNGPIIIGDDVWIGANCTIVDGVHIGTGAVIGANSVVNKDVDPYTIVAGCPAKKIGSRFDYEKV